METQTHTKSTDRQTAAKGIIMSENNEYKISKSDILAVIRACNEVQVYIPCLETYATLTKKEATLLVNSGVDLECFKINGDNNILFIDSTF